MKLVLNCDGEKIQAGAAYCAYSRGIVQTEQDMRVTEDVEVMGSGDQGSEASDAE